MNRIFEDTATAFALKSDSELERAYFLFRMIANEPLVKIGAAATNFAIKAHLPVEKLIRATVFDHFCGGVNEKDCLPIIDKMYAKGVSSVLDYSVEGKETEKQFDSALEKTLEILNFVKENDAMPFAVFKPSGFGRFALYKKVNAGKELNSKEQEEWNRVQERYDAVCQKAHNLDVSLLIDAEESWIQDAADHLVERMMRKFNKDKAIVFNTLQLYRWDRFEYAKKMVQTAKKENFKLGFKLVRGAYLEKENDRAERKGYATPICASKKETDDNFDAVMSYLMDNLSMLSIFAGTHNELSSYNLMDLIEKQNILPNDTRIWFGQLYGMSDNITFNLAKSGYNSSKYMPYGPVKDVIPYLIRRAQENTSVSGQMGRELKLLKEEVKRRKLSLIF